MNEQKQQQQQHAAAMLASSGLLTLQNPPGGPPFGGLLSPSGGTAPVAPSNKRPLSPSSAQQQATQGSNNTYLGPKRKRGRPRRLSGSEAVPLASGLVDNTTDNAQLHVQTEEEKLKEEKVNKHL